MGIISLLGKVLVSFLLKMKKIDNTYYYCNIIQNAYDNVIRKVTIIM
jgi:hypothetical protein